MNLFKIFDTQINLLLTFPIHFLIFAIHVESNLYGTLNFDRDNNELVDIEEKIKTNVSTINHELAIACPAQLPEEEGFNSNYSIGKNCLFVKETRKFLEDRKLVDNHICEHIYKLSIIYHRSAKEIEFGYEVYYNKAKYSNFEDSNYDEFDSISKAYSKTQLVITAVSSIAPSKPNLQIQTDTGNSVTLGFVWIRRFGLKFDDSKKRPIQVIYTLSKSTEIGAECGDYSLGDEVYKQEYTNYIDSQYREQVNIFKNVWVPYFDHECEKKNKCLAKYSLVPAEEFRFRSPEPSRISCSNLTTVPIWQSRVEERLKKLDMFLYALANFAYKPIKVVSGVRDQLVMGKNKGKGNIKISLGKIPVPNIIYKSISYEFGIQQKENGIPRQVYNYTWKAVIIVIYNDPFFNFNKSPDEIIEICPKENCENWGWKEILDNDPLPPGTKKFPNNIFCCHRSDELATQLGMKTDFQPADALNVREFPIFDEESQKLVTENIEQKVIDKMAEMFGRKTDAKDVRADTHSGLSDEDSNRGKAGEGETII